MADSDWAVAAALDEVADKLIRQLLVESACIGATGGLLGLGLAAAGVRLLASMAPAEVTVVANLGLDRVVLSPAAARRSWRRLVLDLVAAFHRDGRGRTTWKNRCGKAKAINGLAHRA